MLAVMTPRSLILAHVLTPRALALLAEDLAGAYQALPGVVGLAPTSRLFAEQWQVAEPIAPVDQRPLGPHPILSFFYRSDSFSPIEIALQPAILSAISDSLLLTRFLAILQFVGFGDRGCAPPPNPTNRL